LWRFFVVALCHIWQDKGMMAENSAPLHYLPLFSAWVDPSVVSGYQNPSFGVRWQSSSSFLGVAQFFLSGSREPLFLFATLEDLWLCLLVRMWIFSWFDM
jgi:hypothetical protein